MEVTEQGLVSKNQPHIESHYMDEVVEILKHQFEHETTEPSYEVIQLLEHFSATSNPNPRFFHFAESPTRWDPSLNSLVSAILRLEFKVDQLVKLHSVVDATPQVPPSEEIEDWDLTAEQMVFMLQHNNEIEMAYDNDDMAMLDQIASSDDFKAIFGTMSFDEAYDRYETMLEGIGDKT